MFSVPLFIRFLGVRLLVDSLVMTLSLSRMDPLIAVPIFYSSYASELFLNFFFNLLFSYSRQTLLCLGTSSLSHLGTGRLASATSHTEHLDVT